MFYLLLVCFLEIRISVTRTKAWTRLNEDALVFALLVLLAHPVKDYQLWFYGQQD